MRMKPPAASVVGEETAMTRNAPAFVGITVLVATACYLAGAQYLGDHRPAEPDVAARLATAIAVLAVIGGAALLGMRGSIDAAMRQTVTWLAAGLAAVVIYTYRAEFREVGGPLVADLLELPTGETTSAARFGGSAQSAGGDRQVVVSAGRGGHFFVEAMVNDTHVQLVADTGATLVSLTAEDARRIGFEAGELDYRHRMQTANGVASAAYVVLDEVTVGPITLNDVRASVSEPGQLAQSLLGMSFLSKLASFHLRGDQLILEQ